MEDVLHVYENLLWDILDDSSKIYILTILMEQNFKGECKLNAVVNKDNYNVNMVISDNYGNEMELPLNVLDILNE